MTHHVLPGLRPQPLSAYLAGLGLIRVLAEQADPATRAAWTPDGLVLESTVDDVAGWLAQQYRPTPVLSPWNEGSGFGTKDVAPKRALHELESRPSPRLGPFRAALPAAHQVAADYRSRGWTKERAVLEFRNHCPEELLPWIDATVVLTDQQTVFPPLLGTGGNDGRLDFSTNYHQRLLDLLDDTPAARARALTFARDLVTGVETIPLASASIGQFDPAGAGGPGSSPFGAADSAVNPWTFVLLIEGALVFAASAVRRNQHAPSRAAIPFTTVDSPAEGSPSGAPHESTRGEIWAPVWTEPFTLSEIRQLFVEARAWWRGRPAQRAVEFYAATRTLGVARGVDSFVRYGLQQRNGLAFVAVPLERVTVTSKPAVRLAARLEDWVGWVRRRDTSHAVHGALRRFDAAHLEFVKTGSAMALACLLAALTTLEQAVGRSGRLREAVPVRAVPPAHDFLSELRAQECPELRVAVGLASCATRPTADAPRSVRSMRQLLLPIDPDGRWRSSPVVPGFGLRPLRNVLADVLVWRCRTAIDEADQTTFRGVPTFRYGIPVPSGDLHAFASGALDERKLHLWFHACLALSWPNVRPMWTGQEPQPLLSTLALLHPLAEGLVEVPAEDLAAPPTNRESPRLALKPDWAVRLAAGQVTSVHDDVARRLRQVGWHAVAAPQTPMATGPAIAAALVPRCRRPRELMATRFATRIKTGNETPEPTEEQS